MRCDIFFSFAAILALSHGVCKVYAFAVNYEGPCGIQRLLVNNLIQANCIQKMPRCDLCGLYYTYIQCIFCCLFGVVCHSLAQTNSTLSNLTCLGSCGARVAECGKHELRANWEGNWRAGRQGMLHTYKEIIMRLNLIVCVLSCLYFPACVDCGVHSFRAVFFT